MSWRKISMKFAGTCVVCNERIEAGEDGLWAKGEGVKHEKCAEPAGIACIVCGGPAGCDGCEFAEECDTERVSQACICPRCGGADDPFGSYVSAAARKFRILGA